MVAHINYHETIMLLIDATIGQSNSVTQSMFMRLITSVVGQQLGKIDLCEC